MLWVGGSIIAHSVDYIGYHGHTEWIKSVLERTGLEGFFIGFKKPYCMQSSVW